MTTITEEHAHKLYENAVHLIEGADRKEVLEGASDDEYRLIRIVTRAERGEHARLPLTACACAIGITLFHTGVRLLRDSARPGDQLKKFCDEHRRSAGLLLVLDAHHAPDQLAKQSAARSG
jgi:hypothetical protein